MESKINYTWVGFFVVLLFTGFVAFIYWLGQYGSQDQYDDFHVLMSESVAGLSTDSSVKYKGVNVGTVKHISLNPENSDQVKLVLRIKQNTPVKVGTTATIQSFGLTGLEFIELEGGGKNAPLLISTTEDIPIIPTKPSTFARIDNSVSSLANKSALALDKFNQLLSEENLRHLSITLAEVKDIAEDTKKQQKNIETLLTNGIAMENKIISAFDKVDLASSSVEHMANNLDKQSSALGSSLSQDLEHSLQLFNQLIFELETLSHTLQRTTQGLKASPSDLIFKTSDPKPGPGEIGYEN